MANRQRAEARRKAQAKAARPGDGEGGGMNKLYIWAALGLVLVLGVGLLILVLNVERLPDAILTIVRAAFTGEAGTGGFVGVLIQGFRRAAFSNEAGCGSSPIVHSAARTEEPVPSAVGPPMPTVAPVVVT